MAASVTRHVTSRTDKKRPRRDGASMGPGALPMPCARGCFHADHDITRIRPVLTHRAARTGFSPAFRAARFERSQRVADRTTCRPRCRGAASPSTRVGHHSFVETERPHTVALQRHGCRPAGVTRPWELTASLGPVLKPTPLVGTLFSADVESTGGDAACDASATLRRDSGVWGDYCRCRLANAAPPARPGERRLGPPGFEPGTNRL
jgi:hypothetical protein